jgi:hypothetical protein
MPPLEAMDRQQLATLWNNTGQGSYGTPVVSATPVQLLVRWVDTLEEGTNEQGEVIQVSAKVNIDPTIPIPKVGSIFRYNYPPPAGNAPGALLRLARVLHGRDIRNRNQKPELLLERYKDSLPLAATA